MAPFQFTVSDAGFDVKLAAHHAGRDAIKARRPELMVGWTLANTDIHAAPGGEANADRIRREVNERFLEASRRDDFVGIQTYGRTVFGAEGLVHAEDGVPTNQMGEEIYPEGWRQLSARLPGLHRSPPSSSPKTDWQPRTTPSAWITCAPLLQALHPAWQTALTFVLYRLDRVR